MDEIDFQPQIPDYDVVKVLYTSKLSKIWLIKKNNQYNILKGRKRSEISSNDFEQLKSERALLEENTYDMFPKMIKSYKDEMYLYMILDFKEGLELNNFLIQQTKLPKEFLIYLASQMINLLLVLKNEKIIYRDLKLNNIIIDMDLNLKLIDFGFAKRLDIGDKTYTICGTYHCMAPEILKFVFNKKEDPNGIDTGSDVGYSYECDVYSYGVFLFEINTGKAPFGYEVTLNNYQAILKGEYHNSLKPDDNIDSSLLNLIESCMNLNVERRPTVEEISKHTYFQGDHKKFLSREFFNNKIKSQNWYDKYRKDIEFEGNNASSFIDQNDDIFDKFF